MNGLGLGLDTSSITDVGWNDIFVYLVECPGLIIDLSDGTTIYVRFDLGWTGRRDTIHWLRGIARIIESNMGSVENSDS